MIAARHLAPQLEERRVAIGLGASLGDRRATLERALVQLNLIAGLRLERASRWYRTPPLKGGCAQGWFLNGVALYRSRLTPWELLDHCRRLEARAGRRRSGFWGDRTLDLDVLLIEGVHVDDAELCVPHPAAHLRPFVLGPLLEIWPDAIDARTGRPMVEHPPPLGPRPVAVGVVGRSTPPSHP
ncbi:MAG: 2-amino-4-hydroxy-6-hydroxymethyldihydropteridine diphosphokinase [Deltaproteobacteria bacterium]|nr:MAG: 2-amino-4-hydroxy-6-hydroxymethyldihydropteridine diphosphokinase [Deltaproteobacteria bacterium]